MSSEREEKFSIILITTNEAELPQFWHDDNPKGKEEKSFRVPKSFTVAKILDFLYKDMNLNSMCTKTPEDETDALAHLELLIKSNVVAPEDGQPQMILLDSGISVQTIRDLLWVIINGQQ